MDSEFILIGTMAGFILSLQFWQLKQVNKLCERISKLEERVHSLH
tara:strand:+ start:365 stop:499 length:135 start_codon:yes stop_codon:yes gene_type:complete